MCKRFAIIAMMLVFACGLAVAGDAPKGAAVSPAAEMKAAMMKCYVCKNVAERMDEIGPMGMEAIQLNDGVSVRHWAKSNDSKKVEAFHAACDACSKAGQETMNWTDAQAKTDLCDFCQTIRASMKAGAHMSQGRNKNGDVMVITSADPAVQASLSEMQKKCAMMASSMESAAPKASAEK